VKVRTLAIVALTVLPAVPALASGLFLKVKPVADRVAEGAPVVLELRAVTTRPFSLPASPQVLVSDKDGKMAPADLTCAPFEADANGNVDLGSSADRKGRCELKLAPGAHKIQLRYKLDDRTVDSNSVKVQVGTQAADAGR
jgi:hypothetical protein